ncbi:MAG: type III pantothenate kinase [Flavobacteriales bacterium]|jgi:type III pantothenate kinase|nr:type III pantothenate kinase [Flavobacteriales bacterium]MBT7481486.1 type III pantothenate kinase [Flavobacteriales bacterium]
MNLVIDIGNTLVKYAVFKNNEVFTIKRSDDFDGRLVDKLLKNNDIQKIIVSSVREKVTINSEIHTVYLSEKTNIPITLKYKTPNTLGKDRLAGVVAAAVLYPNKNVLVIDAGSCITMDYIDKNKVYFGGRISPGIEMRYNSLKKFTKNLPKLTINTSFNLIGNDTNSSIVSGVQSGILAEVETIITDLRKENESLFVVVTGGDTIFFENALKNSIFADPFLVLKGLNEILKYND